MAPKTFFGNLSRGIRAARYEIDYLVSHLDFSVSNTDLKNPSITWNFSNVNVVDGAAIFNNNGSIQTNLFPAASTDTAFTWIANFEIEPNSSRNSALMDSRPASASPSRPGIILYQNVDRSSSFYHAGARTPNITNVWPGTGPRLTEIKIARQNNITIVEIDGNIQNYTYSTTFGNFSNIVTFGQNVDSLSTSAWGLKGKLLSSKIYSRSYLH